MLEAPWLRRLDGAFA